MPPLLVRHSVSFDEFYYRSTVFKLVMKKKNSSYERSTLSFDIALLHCHDSTSFFLYDMRIPKTI